jgi:5-methylcytosine-specific restriction protein A
MARLYSLRQWQRVRRAKLTDSPLCEHHLARGETVAATEVDHIVRASRGGAWFDADNLQSLCKPCHSRKTAAEDGKRVVTGCDVNGIPPGWK